MVYLAVNSESCAVLRPSTSTAMPRRVRRLWPVAALIAMLVGGVGLWSWSRPALDPRPVEPGYLAPLGVLRERASLAGQGAAPYAEAVNDLLEFADAALEHEPAPQEPLEISGTEGPFVDDSAASYGLALAHVVTGDDAYARRAAEIIAAWVETTRTTVDACPDDGACQTSLIIGRTAAGFVFAADLLADHGSFTPATDAAFRRWLREVILPTGSILANNWGDAGTFMRLAVTDYLGDDDGFRAALERWHVQADRIAADGSLPEEVRRGSSGLQYSQEALQYRVAGALLAQRRGIDLWTYRNPAGATIRDALDYAASYWPRPAAWPWDPAVEVPATGPVWELAYERFQEPSYVPIILARRPFGAHGHSALRWTTLTNGLPIE
jgi:Alginate lyase